METKVLVAYATTYGSTQEIAEVISETLRSQGLAAKLRFPYNLIPALKKMPASDLRDWEAIRAWASSLATQFLPDLPK